MGRRRPIGVTARACALVFWLTAIALTTGGCLTLIGLTTASLTGAGPEPPTPAELGDHINANHTDRNTNAHQRLCDQYPGTPGCTTTTPTPTTSIDGAAE